MLLATRHFRHVCISVSKECLDRQYGTKMTLLGFRLLRFMQEAI